MPEFLERASLSLLARGTHLDDPHGPIRSRGPTRRKERRRSIHGSRLRGSGSNWDQRRIKSGLTGRKRRKDTELQRRGTDHLYRRAAETIEYFRKHDAM